MWLTPPSIGHDRKTNSTIKLVALPRIRPRSFENRKNANNFMCTKTEVNSLREFQTRFHF